MIPSRGGGMVFDGDGTRSHRGRAPLVVAEIGTAHNGELSRGKDLIDAACDAGADAVKTQVILADEILPPQAGTVPLPGGPVPLYDVFRSLERPAGFYAALADHTARRGMDFFASPFGTASALILKEIGVTVWKIASPELNHEPLLELLAQAGGTIVLSTGMADRQTVARALELTAPAPTVLLHCVTSYPAPEEQSNIRAIASMAAEFHRPAGLSDHSLHPFLLPALAMTMGAVMVEKHLTIDRFAGGLDDPIALTPDEFARMTGTLRELAPLSDKAVTDRLAEEFGAEHIRACLGDGVKRAAPCEMDNVRRTYRSLHAVGGLKAGTIVTETNTALLRTEKILRPGLAPAERSRAYGRRLVRDISPGDGITWQDLEAGARESARDEGEADDAALVRAVEGMILSASGWRKVFAPGGEHSADPVPLPVDLLLAVGMGRAWGEWLGERASGVDDGGESESRVLVAVDTRPTGPLIAEMLMRGLESAGLSVTYAGTAASPEIMARSACDHSTGAFAYVSASHNPLGHNGVKFGLRGSVIGGEDAAELIDLFCGLTGEPGAADRLAAIAGNSGNVPPAVRPVDREEKSCCLSDYGNFLSRIADTVDGAAEKPLDKTAYAGRHSIDTVHSGEDGTFPPSALALLREALAARPVGIVADLNGSARCLSVDRTYLTSLGVRLVTFNDRAGDVAHDILPEGESLQPCRDALQKINTEDGDTIIGYVPDNDGDRGNLVIWDETIQNARILEAQDVFALCVLAELAFMAWFDGPVSQSPATAIVVNGPTSHRVRDIAALYGAEVYEAEVGEANVVARASRLRGEGYRVRLLGEGSNGGAIVHPAAVRDPMNTITALLKLIRLPARPGVPSLIDDWLRRSGHRHSGKQPPGLGAVMATLPRFSTTPAFSPRARADVVSKDHAQLKSRWEEIFARQWTHLRTALHAAYGLTGWYQVNNEGSFSRVGVGPAFRPGSGCGGLKVVFTDSRNQDAGFLWMRGSGTEPVFRIMTEIRGERPDAEALLTAWQAGMVSTADSRLRGLPADESAIPPPFQ